MSQQHENERIAEEVQAGASPAAESGTGTEETEVQEIERLREELEAARRRAEETWNQLVRAQADLDNLRKRSERDVAQAHKYGLEKFIGELLPVVDSLELGLGHATEHVDAEKLREGMELTLKMLGQVLQKFNVQEVNPLGEPFDPELHQAMSIQENAELPPNTVLTVVQKGYRLNDRLLRPAMVIVSKPPETG
ncbi:MAG TPA: nucleotide exchange factor GrpE [Chromatiales bacterium]|nr:nucleotide exchange factor GrpE [Chromatiales bacterium]